MRLTVDLRTIMRILNVAEKNDAAKNEVMAAEQYAKASEAIKSQKNLDAEVNMMNALAEAIKEGKLTWPETLVMSPGMSLMDLYGAKNLGSSSKNKK